MPLSLSSVKFVNDFDDSIFILSTFIKTLVLGDN